MPFPSADPASSSSLFGVKVKRNGIVLSVTSATRRTESKKGPTSIIAVEVNSVGITLEYSGYESLSIRDVKDLPSITNPARCSLAVLGVR